MNINFPSQVWTILGTITGVLVGTVLNYWLTERSKRVDREINERYKQIDRDVAERGRQLDLYKVIYPEKVKAVQSLMDATYILYQKVVGCALADPSHHETLKELTDSISQVYALSATVAWALSPAVQEQCAALLDMSQDVGKALVHRKDRSDWLPVDSLFKGTGKYHLVYEQFRTAIRHELHLGMLEKLLSKE